MPHVDGLSDLVTTHHVEHWKSLTEAKPAWTEFGLRLGQTYVMFHAEAALMRRHAELLGIGRGARVLDVGVGLGVFAEQALGAGAHVYCGVELHPEVARSAQGKLVAGYPDRVIDIKVGPWQLHLASLGQYDGIMYDTWPPDGRGDEDFRVFVHQIFRNRILGPGGALSFFCSGPPIPFRTAVLETIFDTVVIEPFNIGPLPPQWTKLDGRCTICTGRNLRVF